MRVVALALLLLAPMVAAQDPGHTGTGGAVALVTDLGPDGLAFAGTPAHFAAIAFGDDDEPDFHQDLPMRVLLDNRTLWQTTTSSGHDYDGIAALDITFPHAGTWRVEALDTAGDVLAARQGTVVEKITEEEVRLVGGLVQSGAVRAGTPYRFLYGLEGPAGLLNHTDVWFEVYRDGLLVFRTHTHTHTELQELDLSFPLPGTYTIRRVGYQAFPTETGSAFTPVVAEQTLEVLAPAVAPQPQVGPPQTSLNAVVRGTAQAPFELIGTFDPYTVVGPGTLQHLSALVVDSTTQATVPHVDFTARLEGPTGVLFESSSLHEYDGILEVATQQPLPGLYRLVVTASRGDWDGWVVLPYTVAPPVVATVAGPQILTLAASPFQEGTPTPLTFAAKDVAGRPFAHGELELDLRDEQGLPLLHTKLHTHDDGTFPAILALPAGTHPLHITPFPLMPQPAFTYHQDALGTPLGFALQATPGSMPFDDGSMPEGPAPQASVPGPGVALTVLVAGLAAWIIRRR